MVEAFLLLFAGGVMLAAAAPDARQVTLLWLRLAGIIALALTALSWYFHHRSHPWFAPPYAHAVTGGVILLQLALVQLALRQIQRLMCLAALALAVWFAGTSVWPGGPEADRFTTLLTCIGIAAMVGLATMDMLLGHAYLTASKMTIHPFRRLNNSLIVALVLRAFCAVAMVLVIQHRHPVQYLWKVHGLLIVTRWLVGLAVPAVFLWMAAQCIKRRATQSATGILYVASLLILIGEICALHLARETQLPF